MKNLIPLLMLALAIPGQAYSQDPNTAYWLLMPYATSVASCAAYGTDTRNRLREALATAQRNSLKVLPPTAWELIDHGLTNKIEKTPAPADTARCDAFLNLLQDPKFPTHFRQGIAAQFVLKPALSCIAEQPSTTSRVKEAWLTSFSRQGFSLTEKSLDDFVSQAIPLVKREPVGRGPSLTECENFADDLSGPQFDTSYGEEGIFKLFTAEK